VTIDPSRNGKDHFFGGFKKYMHRLLQNIIFFLGIVLISNVAIAEPRADIAKLAGAKFDVVSEVAQSLAASGDPEIAPFLKALRAGKVHWRKSDNAIFIAEREDRELVLFDAFTGEEKDRVGRRDAKKVKVNNALRAEIDALLAGLTLRAPDPASRFAAAEQLFKDRDASALPALNAAYEAETDSTVKAAFADARAAIVFTDIDANVAERLAAVETLEQRKDRAALTILDGLEDNAPEDLAAAANAAKVSIDRSLTLWGYGQTVWQGLSLGSVLLLAAIGLAITFGVMGVINMAHGELVMLGAYTTFAVQEVIRTNAPYLFDYSLLIALPLAFVVAGGVGVIIERGVVRFLYGRALETLLATWGVSLILQQTVRTIFGPNNREVGNPSWMSGSFDLGGLAITYNRLWIFVFALTVFAALLLVLKRTPLGLQMRAVTQNRAMAANMGIRTGWVDAMTFGLGAGIAGLAGVALSQLDNVSPNLGQSYIVDSFMVVVFGGAGNLWGALAGAFSLGIANKFLEPGLNVMTGTASGAVFAKIIILAMIIVFIQVRPRGLFALRGRAVEQ